MPISGFQNFTEDIMNNQVNEFQIISSNIGKLRRRMETCETFLQGETENQQWRRTIEALQEAEDRALSLVPAFDREMALSSSPSSFPG
jgi:hypothetical protein